jgi:queuine tRNA-ribosyltransferase
MKQAFNISSESNSARTGVLKTAHGRIETPFFMPVATKGSVKFVSMKELEKMGYRCFISNSFLLSIRPGLEVIRKMGGLHQFVGWKNGIFTDSGGFQILREDFLIKVTEEGVHFRNPFDQRKELLTPEKAIRIENGLGSDVAMCLDDVPAHGSSLARLKESQERTTRWAKRCLEAHANKKQLLFGICQGGTNEKLREKSALEISGMDFDGVALGGLCIGEEKKAMHKMSDISIRNFPSEKPRYLMGVGSPAELLESISKGVDIFDSAFPTQTARHGLAFSNNGNLNIRNAQFRNDSKPLDKECNCFVCQHYSRAYLHHLVRVKEENGLSYLSHHNLSFLAEFMEKTREAIEQDRLQALKKQLIRKNR